MSRRFTTTNRWEDLKRLCPDAAVILDCGAHTGQTARNLRQAYPRATIYSFEPVAALYDRLVPEAGRLDVIPVRRAVSQVNGTAEMFLTASSESNSLLPFLQTDNPLAGPHRVVGRETVALCRLDDFCAEQNLDPDLVDLIKMDVQGHELEALRGAGNLLERVRALLLEVAFVPFYEGAPLIDDIDTFVGQRGFRREALYPSVQPELWADALYLRDPVL